MYQLHCIGTESGKTYTAAYILTHIQTDTHKHTVRETEREKRERERERDRESIAIEDSTHTQTHSDGGQTERTLGKTCSGGDMHQCVRH